MPVTVSAYVDDGLDKTLLAFRTLQDVARSEEFGLVVSELADKIIAEAKQDAPVAKTQYTPPGHEAGTLRDKGIGKNVIHHSDTGVTAAYIGFTYFGWYGIFAEFGTVNEPARPFMMPVFERNRQTIIDGIGNRFLRDGLGRFI